MTQLYTKDDAVIMATKAIDSFVADYLGQMEYFHCSVDHREDIFDCVTGGEQTFTNICIIYHEEKLHLPLIFHSIGDDKPADGVLNLAQPKLYCNNKATTNGNGRWAETQGKIKDFAGRQVGDVIKRFLDKNNPNKGAG